MAKIAGEIIISRPAEAVSDFAADQRYEPRYNPRGDRCGQGQRRPGRQRGRPAPPRRGRPGDWFAVIAVAAALVVMGQVKRNAMGRQ